MNRCPGQDMRKLTVSYHLCPGCGKPVEFFSDEMRLRCPHCATMIYKEQAPSCIQWCKAAKDCLGPEIFNRLMGKGDQEHQAREE